MAVFKGVQLKASDGNLYQYNGDAWYRISPSAAARHKVATVRASDVISIELYKMASKEKYETQQSVFDNLLLRGIRDGKIPARTKEARDWYRNIAKDTDIKQSDLLRESSRATNKIVPGRMYMFKYTPKHKNTLPYYDIYPVIFPVQKYSDGFLGINFHYLPLQMRAKLMDSLYSISNNKRFDETTKLKISYSVLESAAKFKYFKPTIHRYLSDHINGKLIEVFSSEWDIGLFLPVAKFKGASQQTVWRDSRNKI